MAISAALLSEDEAEYRAFRDEMMARYSPAESAHKAEHLLKVCLIHPADPPLLKQLHRDVATMGDPRRTPCPAWSALSLSLYHLRSGDHEQALKVCEMGLTSPERKSSCEASLLAVKALTHAHKGEAGEASAALTKAKELATTCDGKDFARGQPTRPYWFDWSIANLLIREAGSHVHG